jgi:hypothetical protein
MRLSLSDSGGVSGARVGVSVYQRLLPAAINVNIVCVCVCVCVWDGH